MYTASVKKIGSHFLVYSDFVHMHLKKLTVRLSEEPFVKHLIPKTVYARKKSVNFFEIKLIHTKYI